MQRARSRLETKETQQTTAVIKPNQAMPRAPKQTAAPPKKSERHTIIGSRYLRHLPLLLVGIMSYIALGYIVRTVHPAQIANVPLTQVYGPFQALLFVGNFCTFSFILLSARRGFLVSVLIAAVLFFKLQDIVLTWWLILLLAVVCVGFEIQALIRARR